MASRQTNIQEDTHYRIMRILQDNPDVKYFEQGEEKISEAVEYTSHNTTRLDVVGMQDLLMKLRFMQGVVRGENIEPEE